MTPPTSGPTAAPATAPAAASNLAPTPGGLRPLDFTLRGSRLIEASAGTGKTFTIAALYLRLVLGHGRSNEDTPTRIDTAFVRPLTPPEILVVTFTEAATGELRDRIRTRLAQAATHFLADPGDVLPRPPGLDFLHDLRADYPLAQWPACARQLRLAAEWMDEAAVSTIHGWCNRMLREHAFDSDSLFTQTLEANQSDLLAEVIRDYWRTFYYPLDDDAASVVRQWWATPESLHAQIQGLLDIDHSSFSLPEPRHALETARRESTSALGELKQHWSRWTEELRTLLDGIVALKQVDGRSLQSRHYGAWLAELDAWALGDHVQPLKSGSKGWERLTTQGLAEVWKAAGPSPTHPALDHMATLPERLAQLPDAREDLLRHAIQWVGARFAQEQDRLAEVGFNDLLTQLDDALQGPNGERLAALIRRQFPVAMIDEFQDTDAVQYRIFDAIYGVASDSPETALILIGDPKQAIYAFRGADIHTYLGARRATAGRHATLGKNYRSTHAMVRAVNHVFDRAEQRAHGKGAFLFRAAAENHLPFVAVDAHGRDEHLWIDGAEAPALDCWWLAPISNASTVLGVVEYRRRMADACATEIVRLLRLGQQGRAGFARSADAASVRPLVAGDIAVLVNKGAEAVAVRRALDAGGVRSVYLSDKESVFANPVAADLQRWLQACAEPEDGRLLRAAIGTATLGLSLPELDRLDSDELHGEARMMQFRGYLSCWRRQGVLPMLRRLLNDFEVPRQLLARGDERTLTDVLHLAELLQVASTTLAGEHALIRHLAEQRAGLGGDADVRQVRLESDAELVKVVTVHKSKGLEYPLVFLPFASAFRATKATDMPLRWHDADGRRQVALKADADVLARVDEERLGEDLRKLYVALTRARFATWIGLAPLAQFERSAVGYLMTGGEAVPAGRLEATLREFAAGCEHLAVRLAPEPDGVRYEPLAAPEVAALSLALPARREAWWIASYSALRTVDASMPVADSASDFPETAAEENFDEIRIADRRDGAQDAATSEAADRDSLHAFPRGAEAGNFLHGLLEWLGRENFSSAIDAPEALVDQIARRCNVEGWSRWIVPLGDWLQRWVRTPLPIGEGVHVRLQDLARVQIEMEFWFAAHHVDARLLDAIVREHTLENRPRPALQPQHLNGMLKGFIDLVFEYEGRYYVADYKSNWLGPRDEDYTPQAMRDAVLHHRYELQYALYLFALHRLLRSRLPGYDYDTHVGGAAYLFLRGHRAATCGVHVERPPRALMDALDRLFTGADEHVGANAGKDAGGVER